MMSLLCVFFEDHLESSHMSQRLTRDVQHLENGFQLFHGTHQLTSSPSGPNFGVLSKNPPMLRSKQPSLPQPVEQSTYQSMHAQSQTGYFTDDAATTTYHRKHIPVDLAALLPISLRNRVQPIFELTTMPSSSLCSPHS